MKKKFLCSILLLTLAISGFSQVTIADWDGVNYTFSGYPAACVVTAPVANPSKNGINTSNNVMRVTTSSDQYDIAYTNPALPSYLNFTSVNSITIKVYSSVAGKVWLKLAKNGTSTYDKVVSGYYFTPGTWQEITFNFYFTSAQNNIYNMISIFPDYEGTAVNNWYIDDIKTVMSPSFTADIISDFDGTIRSFVKQDDATVTWANNPSKTGINTSDKVMQVTTTSLQYEGAICLVESKLDFTSKNTISLKVYSDVAGPIWLKIMNNSNPAVNKVVSGNYFTPGVWQEIKFNFYTTSADNNIYDAITVYPDHGNTGINNWYIDDVRFVNTTSFSSDIISDFDNTIRSFVKQDDATVTWANNPSKTGINTSDKVMQIATTSQQYEGAMCVVESKLDFTSKNTISIKVYSDVAGPIWLEIRNYSNPAENMAVSGNYFTPGVWQELKFNFYKTSADNDIYDAVIVYPDHGNTGINNWYIDDVNFMNTTPFSSDIISDFDNTIRSFMKQDDATVTWANNPLKTGINTSDKVMQVATTSQQYEGAMCIVESKLDFTSKNTISIKVYSDVAGPIWLEIRNYSDQVVNKVISGYYFTPGVWQEIKFNFYGTSADNDIYDAIIVYPDYGNTGIDNWYIDDVKFVNTTSFSSDIISDFDSTIRSFVKQDDATVTWANNPLKTGINTSDKVMQVATTGQQYEGAMCIVESKLDFTSKNTISIKVYSGVAGPIWLEIRNYSDQTVNKVVSGYYFTPGVWQEIKFNFYGTSADNDIYDAIIVYPDYGNTGIDNWYIDDVNFIHIPPFDDDVISNFDDITRYFEDYTQNGVLFPVPNPNSDEVNNTPNCLKVITDTGKYENIKTTLESKIDFSNFKANFINVMVYSSVTGKVLLKLNGPGGFEYITETKTYSSQNSWQQLTFDVTGIASDTYNSITLFPDYEGTGVADWYIDEIMQYHPIDLNMYSNWDGVTLPFTAVGNSSVAQASNPAPSDPVNTSANVLSITTTSQTDEGAKTELDGYMDFSVSAIFTVKVYSSTTGAVRIRLEGTGVTTQEVSVDYTTQDQWQLLTFNFGLNITTDVYNVLSILPDYGSTASGIWYIDDLSGPGLVTPVVLGATYADWETISPNIETWLNMTTSVVSNPLIAGINQSANALQTNTNSGLYEGFAFTIPGVFNFSEGTTFALNVISDQAGPVLFKIESAYGADPVEISAQYTKPGSWQQLVYTFSSSLPSAFNKIAIFPDIGGESVSQWYFDNIQGPTSIDRSIFLTGSSIAEGREDGKVISVSLIGDTYVTTLIRANWVATGLPAGVTIGSVNRVNDTLANVTLSGNSTGQSADDITFTITVNKDEFTSLSSDLSADMKIIAIGDFSETRQERVFVHYMPWYNIEATEDIPAYGMWRHENDTSQINYSNKPLIGEYSQLDEDALEYHFLTMHAAGIDGIIVNINPSIKRDDILTKSILNKLVKMNQAHGSSGFNLKYIISYDNKYLSPTDYPSIYNELKYVRDSLTNNPKYSAYRFNDDKTGHPVLITWSHLGDQDTSYHNAIEDLYNGNIIHIKRGAEDFTSANATFQWINYLQPNTDTTEHVYWGEDYFGHFETGMANQQSIPANQRNYLTIGGVWPGFDDCNAFWSDNRWINRMVDAGETMALTFDRHINYVPGAAGPVKVELPWIQVITWNDWPEGATIEPATEDTYGYTALLTTMVKTAEYKGQAVPGNADSIGVTIPYTIYQARKSGDATYAQCVLDEFLAGNYETALGNCSAGFNILLDVPYSQSESGILNGAACAKMILDYEASNTISQSDIQSYGTSQNYTTNIGADFIDPYGMYRSLNNFELDYRYNYAQITRNTRDEAYRDLCYWISYTIPSTPREHLPSVVPVNGGFNNWFVVDGFQSSADPHVQSDYTVYGFYITDPRYGGVGHKMFVQANTFSTYYYYPISSTDIWNGKYVSVNEPPAGGGEITVELERELVEPTDNDLRFAIVEYTFNDYNLDNNSAILDVLAAGAQRDRIYFVDLDGALYDYYIVTYSRNGDGGCIVVAIIDANNGALKLLTYNEPDYYYYTYLDNYEDATRLKSRNQDSNGINPLYPTKGSISIMNESDVKYANEQALSFEIMPNPSRDFARMQYTITHEGLVYISIIDMSGKTIKTIVNTRQNVGNYNFKMDMRSMDSGIYFVRMATNDKTITKRLVISR